MVDRTKFPQWLRKAQALTYLDEVWDLKYAPGTFAALSSRGLGPDVCYRGRTQLFAPEALDAFARSRVKGPVAFVDPEDAALSVTQRSTAPLPPIPAHVGEWRAAV